MKADFDLAANSYDDTFTNSVIGRMQRQRVWAYLKEKLQDQYSLNILELNCGTGEDAIFMAQDGQQVIATDISSKMLEIAQLKANKARLGTRVQFQVLDINQLDDTTFPFKFDLIFSNFGGLNCLSPKQLKLASTAIQKHLKPKGHFIAVVMPDYCWVETLYFLIKLKFSKMNRRKSKKPLDVKVDGQTVKTWYYSPTNFYKVFSEIFQLKAIQSIGFLPSYLEKLAKQFPFLQRIDERMFATGKFQDASDHYLIDLVVR